MSSGVFLTAGALMVFATLIVPPFAIFTVPLGIWLYRRYRRERIRDFVHSYKGWI